MYKNIYIFFLSLFESGATVKVNNSRDESLSELVTRIELLKGRASQDGPRSRNKDFLGNLSCKIKAGHARKKVGFVHPNVDPWRIIALGSDKNILLLKKMGQLLSFTFNKLRPMVVLTFIFKNFIEEKDASPHY